MHMSTNCENLVNIGFVYSYIIDMPIFGDSCVC